MKEYTYNFSDRAFYEEAYNLLVREAGASANQYERESFVTSHAQVEHYSHEYRFCGSLGFGGKFWRNDERFYVTCYPESRTPERDAVVESVNKALVELAAKHNPRRM